MATSTEEKVKRRIITQSTLDRSTFLITMYTRDVFTAASQWSAARSLRALITADRGFLLGFYSDFTHYACKVEDLHVKRQSSNADLRPAKVSLP